jgi:hypothetical protein
MNRTFTQSQSSAIAAVNLTQLPMVEIAYQTNPDKTYTYSATDSFGQELVQFIGNDQLPGSLGSLITTAVRNGNLAEVTV